MQSKALARCRDGSGVRGQKTFGLRCSSWFGTIEKKILPIYIKGKKIGKKKIGNTKLLIATIIEESSTL